MLFQDQDFHLIVFELGFMDSMEKPREISILWLLLSRLKAQNEVELSSTVTLLSYILRKKEDCFSINGV